MTAHDEESTDGPAQTEDRIYSGDLVLLVLFVFVACVVGLLLFASSRAA